MRTRLEYISSPWRRLLVPFYSGYDAILFVVLLISGTAILFALGIREPFGILLVLGTAYLGGVITANATSAARLTTGLGAGWLIEETLCDHGYEKVGDTWHPPFWKFTRWPGDTVSVHKNGNVLVVTGPHNILVLLMEQLQAKDAD